MDNVFKLEYPFKPAGDQPQAIGKIVSNYNKNINFQTLLGVTGSGKTFTLACSIEKINKPTLVISHNKTLAAQLYSEFKGFFPGNAVEYFVSYYDYYQPEAYIPQTDTYIEKDASINDRLDRLRLSTTSSLSYRKDVLVVASVSAIYNLGDPQDYQEMVLLLKKGDKVTLEQITRRLIDIQYERNDFSLKRSAFRVRGDIIDICPSYQEKVIRVELFDDAIDKIYQLSGVDLKKEIEFDSITIYPAKHFVVESKKLKSILYEIKKDLGIRLEELKKDNKVLEAERLKRRTLYDIEMLNECGWCSGIENYSRYFSSRLSGERPLCLLDYFPKDFLLIIDESHITLPQIRGMYNGDKARKEILVEHGFRLPSCLDNRPLKFDEFFKIINKTIFCSATPSDLELKLSKGSVIEQIIRPTGLVDPTIEIRPSLNQVEDVIKEITKTVSKGQRVLVTTLTKRMAEDLTSYLNDRGLRVKYIHSDLDTIERAKIIQDLRKKEFDCLVGINLLREGIDLPEVALVAIFDADKEGFLRSAKSLIQVSGRAARNIDGKVIMYADSITASMKEAIDESSRRRQIQMEYNKEHKITPKTIEKKISQGIEALETYENFSDNIVYGQGKEGEIHKAISLLEKEMMIAAKNLRFEKAALLRDQIKHLKQGLK